MNEDDIWVKVGKGMFLGWGVIASILLLDHIDRTDQIQQQQYQQVKEIKQQLTTQSNQLEFIRYRVGTSQTN
jgi:hypothetical protein